KSVSGTATRRPPNPAVFPDSLAVGFCGLMRRVKNRGRSFPGRGSEFINNASSRISRLPDVGYLQPPPSPVINTIPQTTKICAVWSWRSRNPVAGGSRRAPVRAETPRSGPFARQNGGRVQEGREGSGRRGERAVEPAGGDRAGTREGSTAS